MVRAVPSSRASSAISSVGFLLIPGYSLMGYASAVEPLRAANQLAGRELYRWWYAAPFDAPAAASNGAAILPDFKLGAEAEDLDLFLVCSGANSASFNDPATFAWLRRLARQDVIIGGIAGGPFIMARAGLLNGRSCTVHWELWPAFEETFPEIELTRSIFHLDDKRVTCSGGTAALDMLLALIERDHGHELSAAVSDGFLHTQIRESVHPQRMDLRSRWGVANEKVLAALEAMENNIEAPLSREEIADIAGLSLRQLERAFKGRLRRGVHEHYLALRFERARQLLRDSSMPILDVAIATGFSSSSHFARAFRRAFGVSPTEARQQYQPRETDWSVTRQA